MAAEEPARVGRALDNLEHALRQPRGAKHLAKLDGRKRRQLCRLEDHRIAAGERRSRLPAGDLQRIVPGADSGDYPQRLTPGIAECLRAEVNVLTRQARRERSKILKTLGARDHIDDTRLLDRLTRVARLKLCKLIVARAQYLGGPAQNAATRSSGSRRPFALRLTRTCHRVVYLGRTVNADVCEHFAGGRIQRCKSRCSARIRVT